MELVVKIFRYELNNSIRSKWTILYSVFFFLLNYILLSFDSGSGRSAISMMNIVLIVVPLVSLIFGAIYVYNSREYIEMILCQPIDRKSLFIGLYLGNTIPLSSGFMFGMMLPLLLTTTFENLFPFLILTFCGVALTFVFTSVAFGVSIKINDRVKGFGISILTWLLLAVIYDGILLFIIYYFSDYPIENVVLGVSMLNPIDLARIIFILNFDVSALMGYTGALFQKFLGEQTGFFISIISLLLWCFIPTYFAYRKFLKKDF
ncbi:MAG: ABC transporter permease subunit [Ignavibacteriales bacterium]|nr:MAG: ABC transporter permease subunit [Ignavibacteriales bacterium]